MNLSKKELRILQESADEVGLPIEKALEILEYYKLNFKDSVSKGKIIRIPTIGVFYPSNMKARKNKKEVITEETIEQYRKERREYWNNKHKQKEDATR
jgi:nucleoid DNA-binding protein